MKKNDPPVTNEPKSALSQEGSLELGRQMQIAQDVMVRRREALRELALAEKIMDEDREILRELSKK